MKTSYLILQILGFGLLFFALGHFQFHHPFLSNAIESLIYGTFVGCVNDYYYLRKNMVKKQENSN